MHAGKLIAVSDRCLWKLVPLQCIMPVTGTRTSTKLFGGPGAGYNAVRSGVVLVELTSCNADCLVSAQLRPGNTKHDHSTTLYWTLLVQ